MLLVAWTLGAGCAVHEGGFESPVEPPETFLEGEASPEPATPIADRWWEAFEDDRLDELQEAALAGNFDLATFRDRLRAAREVVAREEASLLPSLDYSALGEQTRRESNEFDAENRFGASLIGTYEVDVWGGIASGVDVAELQREVARERLKAAAITLSADVALTWYALVEQRGQADVLDAQIETNERVLEVVRARFGGGVVRASDVLRQERLLESTREQRALVRSRIEVLEHALLVLAGRSPTDTLASPSAELPELPVRPAPGLPSDLVRRRPDIRSALYAIRAADSAIAVSVADRYPSVTLSLEASTLEEQVADLFDDWAAMLRIDVVGPIFDAGRRKAEVRRAEAVKAERVNVYAQTVLVAFRQVVDAISRESARDEQIARIRRQLELARRTSERLNREYLNGDISYIDVLEALTTQQQLQRDLLSARFLRIGDRIDLHTALAGGWEGIVPQEGARAAAGDTSRANP